MRPNRLTAVTSGTHRSEFTYNGLSQRVKIIEKDNGNVTSTKQFVWTPGDAQPSEERDGSNAVTKRFYAQGEQANYYYTRDHLGSVREMTDSSGAVLTRYDYDPYGRRTKVSGTFDADFGFTGHYYHQPSGLHLALYRAYDADLGRWLSRDPIGEKGVVNLYSYVVNEPIGSIDPLGLDPLTNPVVTMVNFLDQYFRMRDPKQPPLGQNRDKYFHCMANCQSAKAGGILDSLAIDFGREGYDNIKNACKKKGLSPDKQLQDSLEDMRANLEGLKSGLTPFQRCASKCSALR